MDTGGRWVDGTVIYATRAVIYSDTVPGDLASPIDFSSIALLIGPMDCLIDRGSAGRRPG